MLARIQQILVMSVLAVAISWLATFWGRSVVVALAGFFCTLFLYSGLLAIQFVFSRSINRRDCVPRASRSELVQAWLVETIVAARVFFWWQPFRSNAIPDQTLAVVDDKRQRGIVFLHGFVCNRGLWTIWFRALRRRGIAFVAVNLEPVFGSIDDYAPIVDQAVRNMTLATGKPPLLVCHSMGGLVARAWLRASNGEERVHHIVTIGSPHHGTMIGDLSHRPRFLVNGEQMRFHSKWLAALEREEPFGRAGRFTCFYSNCDNIVMPAATAKLHGADNRFVPGVPHLALALDQTVLSQSLAML